MRIHVTASKGLIAYYSRTEATRSLTEALAKVLQADVMAVIDGMTRSGILGYVRSVAESLQEHAAPIEPIKIDPASYELVVIGTLVWAWWVSPPVRPYLTTNRGRLPDVAFFCMMGGGGSGPS